MFLRRNKRPEEPKPEPAPTPPRQALPEPEKPKPSQEPARTERAAEKTPVRQEAPVKREDFKAPGRDGSGALLGRGSRFKGKLTFDGTVVIEGEFIGDIESEGHLEVGKDAKVDGTIKVKSAIISGEVGGTISTSGELELKASARVTGDLEVESLVVERGATFDGSVKMRTAGARAPAARPPKATAGEAPPIVAPPKG